MILNWENREGHFGHNGPNSLSYFSQNKAILKEIGEIRKVILGKKPFHAILVIVISLFSYPHLVDILVALLDEKVKQVTSYSPTSLSSVELSEQELYPDSYTFIWGGILCNIWPGPIWRNYQLQGTLPITWHKGPRLCLSGHRMYLLVNAEIFLIWVEFRSKLVDSVAN